LIGILEIIFLHYAARSFCETIKLPKEVPKIAKCLKCLKLRNSIDFMKKKLGLERYPPADFKFSWGKYQMFKTKTERSDLIILAHFSAF